MKWTKDAWDGVPTEWIKYCESGLKPDDIPDRSDMVYADEWQGWDDFLGGKELGVTV